MVLFVSIKGNWLFKGPYLLIYPLLLCAISQSCGQWDSVVTTDNQFKEQRTFCLRAFASLVGFCCSLSAKRNHLVKWLCLCVLLWDTEIIFPTPANKNEQLSLFNQWKEAAAANTCKPLQVFLFLFCFAFQFFNLFSQTPAESSLGCNP